MMRFKLNLLFLVLTLMVNNTFAQRKKESSNVKPFSIGYSHTIHSSILAEDRILNVYLPEGYSINDTSSYAVIYLLDGSADEDFIHVAGLVQFANFPWVNMLSPSIVVGISNTDRKRDFTFPSVTKGDEKIIPTSGGSANFIQSIETEIIPFIEKNYKTNSDRILIGQSLGGLLAAEILLKKPTLFNSYILISPSLWWDNGSLISYNSTELNSEYGNTCRIYLAVGKEGLAPSSNPHVMEVDANLFYEKLSNLKNPNLKLYFDYLPLENHATISHQALLNAFRSMQKQ